MIRGFMTAVVLAGAGVLVSGWAAAEESASASVVRSQFTDKVEHSLPSGDASKIGQGQVATYWVEVNNPGEATALTLVWKLDGKEIVRQSLDVGRAPAWRTWGTCPTRSAKSVEVEVLDKDGKSVKTDSTTLS
jgi:hypothetical protein